MAIQKLYAGAKLREQRLKIGHTQKDFAARQPIGRLATVDDMTPTIVHLLSDDSSYVTGQASLVDGGVTI